MKQTVYYLKPDGNARYAPVRGLGMIRDARARNVKAFFGLWLGLFAFTAVWACVGVAQNGFVGMQEHAWAQLVVLLAAMIFYLSAKPLRHHQAVIRATSLPVTLSLIACALAFGSAVLHSGRQAQTLETGFWSALRDAGPGATFKGSALVSAQTGLPLAALRRAARTLDPAGSNTKA